MSKERLIQKLLRPAVEIHSALTAAFFALLIGIYPNWFMLTPAIALPVFGGFVLIALWRGRQGFLIMRYQSFIKRLPFWSVAADDIEWSKDYLVIGKGFKWQPIHTKRMYEVKAQDLDSRYLTMGSLYYLVRRLHKQLKGTVLSFLINWSASPSTLNPFRPIPPVGGAPALHGVGLYEPHAEKDINLNNADRQGHSIVLGTTGVGKTRLAELLISQDIMRGDVVIVLDPKGDADLLLQMYLMAVKSNRLDDFYIFHLGFPEQSARYNPVGSFARITEVATRISKRLPGEGQSAAFREFVWRYVNVITKATTALGDQISYTTILEHAQDIEPLFKRYMLYLLKDVPDFEKALNSIDEDRIKAGRRQAKGRSDEAIQLLELVKDKDLVDDVQQSLHKTWEYDKSYFDKLVASLLPLLEKLSSGKIADLLAPDLTNLNDARPAFDWSSVIRTKGIVYVGLDALSDAEVASVVGSAMLADLTSVAGRIYKHGTTPGLDSAHIPIQLHADEFNELIQEEFIPMLNKARGAGINVTAYTQSLADIESRLGSKSMAQQVIDNFNTVIMMRVRSAETAEILTTQMPTVNVPTQMTVSTASGNPNPDTDIDFTSSTQTRTAMEKVLMIDTDDVIKLPKGQAFALMEGGTLYKLRLPLASRASIENLPDNIVSMATHMKKQYASNKSWHRFSSSWEKAA